MTRVAAARAFATALAGLAAWPASAHSAVADLLHALASPGGLHQLWRAMTHDFVAGLGLPVLACGVLILLMLARVRRRPALVAGLAGCGVLVATVVAGFGAAQSSNVLFQLVMLAALVLTPWGCVAILGAAFAVSLAVSVARQAPDGRDVRHDEA